jgi:hypothetical protein
MLSNTSVVGLSQEVKATLLVLVQCVYSIFPTSSRQLSVVQIFASEIRNA